MRDEEGLEYGRIVKGWEVSEVLETRTSEKKKKYKLWFLEVASFPWYKHLHQDWLQVTYDLTTSSKTAWIFSNQL